MRGLMLICASVLALVAVSYGKLCPRFWIEENNSCYLMTHGFTMGGMILDGMGQQRAHQFCRSQAPGAGLVTINDPMENQFLYDWVLMSNLDPPQVWTGLHCPYTNYYSRCQWQWMSGEPVTYTNFDQFDHRTQADPGSGAILFNVDPRFNRFGGPDVAPMWDVEQAFGEQHYFICELRLAMGPTTDSPMNATTTPPTGPGPFTPPMVNNNNPFRNNQPVRLSNKRFGGTGLHEILRRPRPAFLRQANRNPVAMP